MKEKGERNETKRFPTEETKQNDFDRHNKMSPVKRNLSSETKRPQQNETSLHQIPWFRWGWWIVDLSKYQDRREAWLSLLF